MSGTRYGDKFKTRRFCPFAQFLCNYSPTFGPWELQTFGEFRGPVMGTSSKLVDLVHSVQFSMLLLTDSGSRGARNVRGTSGTGYGDLVKTRRFGAPWTVSMLLLIDSGSRGTTNIPRTPGTDYGDLVKTRRFGPF